MKLTMTMIGRLGKDPEQRETKGNGTEYLSFSLAASLDRGKDKDKETVWVNVTIWNERLVKFIGEYAKKGDLLYITGEPSADAYEGRDGETHATLNLRVGFNDEAILLSSKSDREEGERPAKKPAKRPVEDELDDDIPF